MAWHMAATELICLVRLTFANEIETKCVRIRPATA